ncbi:MAG: Flp pilus assembly complex ATPase component TadA [Planctomycetes bacterium]|nr:Flp pilus assembly complex ATPase component TadA [Planctomycetota bacterium]
MDIGEILLLQNVVSREQLQLAKQNAGAKRLDHQVIEMGLATEDQVLQALATELGMKYVDLTDAKVDKDLLNRFPAREIFRHTLLPLSRRNGSVVIATSDPFDLEALDEIGSLSGFRLEPVLARHEDIARHIKEQLGVGGDTIGELVAQRAEEDVELLEGLGEADGELAEMAQAASVVKLVNELLIEALNQNTSDVHLEPQDGALVVRFRVDGLLRVQPLSQEVNFFQAAIISRLKIMAKLNIAEKRLPQDGRIKLRIHGREIDVRMSIIPMMHGEGVVLRILDKGRMVFDLKNVGFSDEMAKTFRELLDLPHGIVLVTGPTGSGKTTTLYSALNEIKSPSVKIITVEDPVEYQTPGISQIQVHSKIGLTFAAGLRSILRHDPDVILIGEIRDGETANSAIQASLTGHLVFSTLHTNDASGAFTRLVDMGVEPYLVASTVEGVLAQRLVRVLCPHCKAPFRPTDDDVPADFPRPLPEKLFRPAGCRQCRDSGYKGRQGIFELLRTDEGVRQLCVERASAVQIHSYGLRNGLTTLRQDGWRKVLAGITTTDEVSRITKAEYH